ncbi:MAG TPA: hypothetical protein VJ925_10050, partial [Longimicrobiales bacterium]|nr:hypothetical protein [Longimicrobiales bacterium]
EFTLDPVNDWTFAPDTTSKYEISALLSEQTTDYGDNQLNTAPVTDDYVVVLTGRPDAEVVVDATPEETRTYNSDDAFNPDTNFGEANEEQVRAATERVRVELSGKGKAGETWILGLVGLDSTLGVDAVMARLVPDLADGTLDNDYTGLVTPIFYQPNEGESAESIATGLATYITDNLSGTYTVTRDGTTLVITSDTDGARFYTAFAITPDTRGDFTSLPTLGQPYNQVDPYEIEVELTGFVTEGETWTIALEKVDGTLVSVDYTAAFRDDLATVARELAEKLSEETGFDTEFDLEQRGRVLTITHATADQTGEITGTVTISPDSAGGAIITPQLVFTPENWFEPQTVTLQAIDDDFIDGGDALVFPAFEERVNEIRGPLTVRGAPLAGEERFLNDPFRLPEETNERAPDGALDEAVTNLDGDSVLTDREAFHFNARLGERPGFDPRMNDFPFEFTFLDGPAISTFLDVQSVSGEILSIARDRPFEIDLGITGSGGAAVDLSQRLVFSGTPELDSVIGSGGTTVSVLNADLEWQQAIVSFTGTAVQGETWSVTLNDGAENTYEFTTGPFSKSLSRIAREIAAAINEGGDYVAEAFVDILGNSKIRISSVSGAAFTTETTIGNLGKAVISGTPDQSDFTEILAGSWTLAAFEVISAPVGETWALDLTDGDGTLSYSIETSDATL